MICWLRLRSARCCQLPFSPKAKKFLSRAQGLWAGISEGDAECRGADWARPRRLVCYGWLGGGVCASYRASIIILDGL